MSNIKKVSNLQKIEKMNKQQIFFKLTYEGDINRSK